MAAAEDDRQNDRQPAASPYIIRDPEAFARNIARAIEQGGRAIAAYLKPHEEGKPADLIAEATTEVIKTLAKIGEYWTSDPARLMEAQTRLFASYFTIWQEAMARTAGSGLPFGLPSLSATPDRRFSDPEWSENPMFSALKQLYLATTRWAEELVDRAEGVDDMTRHKARFYLRQINNALSPTNFVLTNPEVLKLTAETSGENLVKGMRMLAEDVESGKGVLTPRQTDTAAFELGRNLATTPGKVIFRDAVCEVIQYAQTTDTVFKHPLLIVPPWINKFYVLDLTPEKSLIRWLVDQGHTVFVISWINPDERHADKGFEAYMTEGILEAIGAVEKATGEKKINVAGYCVGGTLLAITVAQMAASGDDRVASMTLLTAQLDFEDAGDLKVFASADQIATMEAKMKQTGYLEGSKMATAFNLLRSNDLIWPYVVNDYLKGKEPLPFDLLYWNADATRMPAANHSFYLRNCYLENNLSRGRMKIAGERVDLARITIPVYNLATREDHIAPAKSVFVGSGFLGGPVRYVLSGSGHIAGVVNPPARRKYQYWTGSEPKGRYEDWLKRATEHSGSWWVDWQDWLEALDGRRVKKKRRPGGGRLKPLGEAPGEYVKVRG
jgi:polyhydroxyalkanoate synthase